MSVVRISTFVGALLVWLVTLSTAVLARTNYALIVGVTRYENYPERLWLEGPNNDAILAYNFLTSLEGTASFTRENVRILITPANEEQAAIAGSENENPTREAILEALAQISAETKDGDFVFLHFAGHGSTQINLLDAYEIDGRDEVFLPYDAGSPKQDSGGLSHYPNALTDNDFARALNDIRSTGADVWAVFDFCHSGSVTRDPSLAGEEIDRRLDMTEDFGTLQSWPLAAEDENKGEGAAPFELADASDGTMVSAASDVSRTPDVGQRGSLVAFFAAQSTETTKEKPFVDGVTDTAVWYGIFSRALYASLATNRNPELTYRQLADTIFQTYVGWNRRAPTPMFQGNLDLAVLGTNVSNPQMQWVANTENGSVTIPAGRIHGLTDGAELLALPSAVSDPRDSIGLFRVTKSEALRSILELLPGAGRITDPAELPPGVLARTSALDYGFALRIARPEVEVTDPLALSQVNEALDAIAADEKGQLNLEIVGPDDVSDLRLLVLSEREMYPLADPNAPIPSGLDVSLSLWLLAGGLEAPRGTEGLPPRMSLNDTRDGAFPIRLHDNLVAIYRAMGLARFGNSSTLPPRAFALRYYFQRQGMEMMQTMEPTRPTHLGPGDIIYVEFVNNAEGPIDLNLLYVEADYEIKHACRARLGTNEYLFEPLIRLSAEDIGGERLIAVIQEGYGQQQDLSYLARTGLVRDLWAYAQGLDGLIQRLSDGTLTRGDVLPPPSARTPLYAVIATPFLIVPTPRTAAAVPPASRAAANVPPAKFGCERD